MAACIVYAPIFSMTQEVPYESRAQRIERFYHAAQRDPLLYEAFTYAALHITTQYSENQPLLDTRYTAILKEWKIIDSIHYMPLGIHTIFRLHYTPLIQATLAKQAAEAKAVQEYEKLRKHVAQCYSIGDSTAQKAFIAIFYHIEKQRQSLPMPPMPGITAVLQKWNFIDYNRMVDPKICTILRNHYASQRGLRLPYYVFPSNEHFNQERVAKIHAQIRRAEGIRAIEQDCL